MKTWLRLLAVVLFLGALSVLALGAVRAQEGTPPVEGESSVFFGRYHIKGGMLSGENPADMAFMQMNPPEDVGKFDYSIPSTQISYQAYTRAGWEIFSNEVQLTNNEVPDLYPRLQRGGGKIVYTSVVRNQYQVFSMDSNGWNNTQLTIEGENTYPYWSPDGSKIVFESTRDGQAEVYVMNADGSNPTRLTFDGDYDGMPSFSPDGSKILFVSRRTGGYRVYVMNADGSGVTQLSSQAYSARPYWAPDGTWIVYDCDANQDGWLDIWKMKPDGSEQQEMTAGYTGVDYLASGWTPNSVYTTASKLAWLLYDGTWYLSDTKLMLVGNNYVSWYPINRIAWHFDWQTLDTQAPIATLNPLPAVSPAFVRLTWTATDPGGCGITNQNFYMRHSPDEAWQYFNQNISWFSGIGGKTYYLQMTARDACGNIEALTETYEAVTTIENLPPRTRVQQAVYFDTGNQVEVAWLSSEPGGSGVKTFELQTRRNGELAWQPLDSLNGEAYRDPLVKYVITGTIGDVVQVRMRGIDWAQNAEAWSDDPANYITIYFYQEILDGQITDLTGIPLQNVETVSNLAVYAQASDAQGLYKIYAKSLPLNAIWQKQGYASSPSTNLNTTDYLSRHPDVYLPPLENLIQNGDFESLNLSDWEITGTLPISQTPQRPNTGAYSLRVGNQPGFEQTLNFADMFSIQPTVTTFQDDEGAIHFVQLENASATEVGLSHRVLRNGQPWHADSIVFALPGQMEEHASVLEGRFGADGRWHFLARISTGWFYIERDPQGNWSSAPITSDFQSAYNLPWIVDTSGVHIFGYRQTNGDETSLYHGFKAYQSPLFVYRKVSSVIYAQQECSKILITQDGLLHYLCGGHFIFSSATQSWSQVTGAENYIWDIDFVRVQGNQLVALTLKDDVLSLFRYTPQTGWRFERTLYAPVDNSSYVWVYASITAEQRFDVLLRDSDLTRMLQIVETATGWETRPYYGDFMPDIHIAQSGTIPQNHLCSVTARYNSANAECATTRPGNFWNRIEYVGSIPVAYDVYESAWIHATYRNDNGLVLFFAKNQQAGPRKYEVFTPRLAESDQSTQLSQHITLPADLTNPTLAFMYHLSELQSTPTNPLTVWVQDAITTTQVFSSAAIAPAWQLSWVDLSRWQGQSITLTFDIRQTTGEPIPEVWLDDIKIGSGKPDLSLDLHASHTRAVPGDSVTYTLTLTNQGYFAAQKVDLNLQLPAGITLLESSLPPTPIQNRLTWVWESLAARSSVQIVLRVQLNTNAAQNETLLAIAQTATTSAEIQTENNSAQWTVDPRYKVFVPLIER